MVLHFKTVLKWYICRLLKQIVNVFSYPILEHLYILILYEYNIEFKGYYFIK
jgi:hypothetical protein